MNYKATKGSMLLLLLLVLGCDQPQHRDIAPVQPRTSGASTTTTSNSNSSDATIGRFQPFQNLAGVALDTKTGRLCKTYDWHSKKSKYMVIPSPYENAPLCSSLSRCDCSGQ